MTKKPAANPGTGSATPQIEANIYFQLFAGIIRGGTGKGQRHDGNRKSINTPMRQSAEYDALTGTLLR